MAADQTQKAHKDPRISINKLGEYSATNKPARRLRILQDSKFPPTYQVIRYDPTREIIQKFLSGSIANTQFLQQEIDKYSKIKTSTDFEDRMKKSNIEALGFFLQIAPTLDFDGATLAIGHHAPKRLEINDVSISVRPDLMLSASKKGADGRGGIKLNISKGSVHTVDSADYVGTVLRHYLTGQHGADACDYRLCYTLDVFGKKLSASPKAVTNRMKDIEAACAEIARQWDSIEPA